MLAGVLVEISIRLVVSERYTVVVTKLKKTHWGAGGG